MLKYLSSAAMAAVLLGQSALADPLAAFDVAEDHTRIFMAAQPVHDNGMPAHGNAFISQGYIYPAGTLEADTTGVLEDGSPAFPELVLGTWTCDGYFVGEGGNATTGVWIISRQVFAFNDGETVVTQGTELADVGVENLRPITGATKEYARFDRGRVQTTLGFNQFMAINATYAFEMPGQKRAEHPHGSFAAQDVATDAVRRDHMPADQTHHLEWDSGFPVGPIDDPKTPAS